MSLLQAVLIALLGWLTHTHTPFMGGGIFGWYCVGRPLVASLFIGLILGDVTTAMQLGVYIQLIFIGLVTPGGSISPDMNLATFIALPLAIVSNMDSGTTVALAVTVASLGTIMSTPVNAAMLLPVHYQKKLVEEGKLQAATYVPIWGHIIKFCFRFIPVFVCIYFGQGMVTTIVSSAPEWLLTILKIFGNPMCLVGFAILMKLLVRNTTDLIYFAVGFAFVSVLHADMITVLIFALLFALIEFKVSRAKRGVM